jgi:hypothetical protein
VPLMVMMMRIWMRRVLTTTRQPAGGSATSPQVPARLLLGRPTKSTPREAR